MATNTFGKAPLFGFRPRMAPFEYKRVSLGRYGEVVLKRCSAGEDLAALHESVTLLNVEAGVLRVVNELGSPGHQNIVRLVAVQQETKEGTGPCLVLEGTDGTLAEWIAARVDKRVDRDAPPAAHDWLAVVNVAQQLVCGLTFCHQYSIVHGDIKPTNVWVIEAPDGKLQVKVAGFACAITDRGSSHPVLKPQGDSLRYAAPESCGDMPFVVPASDVYALGGIMYWLASGVEPWDEVGTGKWQDGGVHTIGGAIESGPAEQRFIAHLCAGGRPSLEPLLAMGVHPQLVAVIQDCWHADPASRPSMEVLTARLRALSDCYAVVASISAAAVASSTEQAPAPPMPFEEALCEVEAAVATSRVSPARLQALLEADLLPCLSQYARNHGDTPFLTRVLRVALAVAEYEEQKRSGKAVPHGPSSGSHNDTSSESAAHKPSTLTPASPAVPAAAGPQAANVIAPALAIARSRMCKRPCRRWGCKRSVDGKCKRRPTTGSLCNLKHTRLGFLAYVVLIYTVVRLFSNVDHHRESDRFVGVIQSVVRRERTNAVEAIRRAGNRHRDATLEVVNNRAHELLQQQEQRLEAKIEHLATYQALAGLSTPLTGSGASSSSSSSSVREAARLHSAWAEAKGRCETSNAYVNELLEQRATTHRQLEKAVEEAQTAVFLAEEEVNDPLVSAAEFKLRLSTARLRLQSAHAELQVADAAVQPSKSDIRHAEHAADVACGEWSTRDAELQTYLMAAEQRFEAATSGKCHQ